MQSILSLIQIPTEQLRILGTRVSRILHEGDGLHELPALSSEREHNMRIRSSEGGQSSQKDIEKVRVVLNVSDADDNLMKMKLMERKLEKANEEVRWITMYVFFIHMYTLMLLHVLIIMRETT